MARLTQTVVGRSEGWGILQYDISEHQFHYRHQGNTIPYAHSPVVLNFYLTMNCNMNCIHCVVKDFTNARDMELRDMRTLQSIIDWINRSPFLVVVITGGEPFLSDCQDQLRRLLGEVRDKGLIIDTNGTIAPSSSVLRSILESRALVRVSWDSVRSADEIYLRRVSSREETNRQYFDRKLETISGLQAEGVTVAIQSVLYKKNLNSILGMPPVLQAHSLTQWYIQRLIPSHRVKERVNLPASEVEYSKVIRDLIKDCRKRNIDCKAKKDRRHNCVFLLAGNGHLYTQGEEPGQKILLGTVGSDIRYFDYVSASDHADRYYG